MADAAMKQAMETAEQVLYKTYNRYQVVFERGDGVHLYDTEGTEYLDFFAGIAVNGLGYHYPGYDEALKAQVDKFLDGFCAVTALNEKIAGVEGFFAVHSALDGESCAECDVADVQVEAVFEGVVGKVPRGV